MITLNASGSSVTFTFDGNSTYLNDGTITVPKNSLALIADESDMVTFRKSASNDIFVSANIAEFGMTKAELESWFKANAVGSTGGGGGGVTPSEVQTMIDEAVSGKADSSIVEQELSTKLDVSAYTPTDLSEYWTSAQTSSAIDEATSGKANQSDFTAYTAATDAALSGKADSSAVTEEISAAVSGKVNVSDNVVSAHTFDARSADGGIYYTKLKFNGNHFGFNDFHSKKISVYPFGGLNGQLFTSLYVKGPDYASYDAAAYLSGSTSSDYPTSFTSVTWTGDETKMKVEINSEGYLDLIAQGDYWFGQIDSNVTQELYLNILNDIASGQSASVINDSIVNSLENLGNTINGIQYEINGKLDASAYTPINVDSALSQTSTNPIQNKSLFNELRVSGASSGETTIVFVNRESTNYPEGVTVIKFEPTQSNTWASYEFYNGSSYLGHIQVSYYGNISVELSLDGATYTTSGNTVILTVPTTLGINKIAQFMGEYSNFTVKVENPPIYTTLKDVVANKQDTLIAGDNITISGNVISVTGGGKAIEAGRGISVTTGETADTVAFNLPIYSGGSVNNNVICNSTSNKISGESYVTNCFLAGGDNVLSLNGTSYGNFYNALIGENNKIEKDTTANSECNILIGKGNKLSGGTTGTILIGTGNSGITTAQCAFGSGNAPLNKSETNMGFYSNSVCGTTMWTFGDSGNTLFAIGNGIWNNNQHVRHNALEIRQNGDVYIADTNDTSTSKYYEKPMIKLQDALGGGGSSYSAGTGIDITNDVISVTGMVATSAFTAHTSDTTVHVTSAEKSAWGSKANVWCGDETAWGQISGGTLDSNTLYLVY